LAVQGIKRRYGIDGSGGVGKVVVSERLIKLVNEYFSGGSKQPIWWWGI